jgi:hypothetical protein
MPTQFRGDWYSYESGEGINTEISENVIGNKVYRGNIQNFKKIEKTHPTNFDAYVLFYQEQTSTT